MAGNENPQSVRTARALERLGRLSLRELSMESLLHTVADLAETVMPGDPEASVSLLVQDEPTTVVHTGQLAVDLDERQYERGRDLAGNLQAALESRAVINQAEGVLMERLELTPDQAFQLLVQASMTANRTLRDVADDLVLTGELPVVAPRGDRGRSGPGRRGPGGR